MNYHPDTLFLTTGDGTATYSVSLRIYGEAFDAEAFQEALPDDLKGELRPLQSDDSKGRRFWTSVRARLTEFEDESSYPDAVATALILRYAHFIKKAWDQGAMFVSCDIGCYIKTQTCSGGLCMGRELIALLHETGVIIDFDIVTDMAAYRQNLQAGDH